MTDGMTQIGRARDLRHASLHCGGGGQTRLTPRLSHIHGCGSEGGHV